MTLIDILNALTDVIAQNISVIVVAFCLWLTRQVFGLIS